MRKNIFYYIEILLLIILISEIIANADAYTTSATTLNSSSDVNNPNKVNTNNKSSDDARVASDSSSNSVVVASDDNRPSTNANSGHNSVPNSSMNPTNLGSENLPSYSDSDSLSLQGRELGTKNSLLLNDLQASDLQDQRAALMEKTNYLDFVQSKKRECDSLYGQDQKNDCLKELEQIKSNYNNENNTSEYPEYNQNLYSLERSLLINNLQSRVLEQERSAILEEENNLIQDLQPQILSENELLNQQTNQVSTKPILTGL
ncbi:MAG: hypothetical protein HQK51_04025 [Oligoflexia bacterium]|nr:hypothetical protein [Oligoflexia bacterium]